MSDVPTDPPVEPAPEKLADTPDQIAEAGISDPQGADQAVPGADTDPQSDRDDEEGQPEQTDNSVREEDGEQDVSQDEAPEEGSV